MQESGGVPRSFASDCLLKLGNTCMGLAWRPASHRIEQSPDEKVLLQPLLTKRYTTDKAQAAISFWYELAGLSHRIIEASSHVKLILRPA